MFSGIMTFITSWYMANINYGTVTLLMIIESSFIPFPSEIVVPPAAYKAANGDLNIYLVILFSTLGAIIGALINYYLAFFLRETFMSKFVSSRLGAFFLLDEKKVQQAERFFLKYGNLSTLIGRLVPGIRQLISLPAGATKMPIFPFLLFTTIGATIWNIILAVLGYYLYGQKELLDKYYHELSVIFLLVGVLFFFYMVFSAYKKKTI